LIPGQWFRLIKDGRPSGSWLIWFRLVRSEI